MFSEALQGMDEERQSPTSPSGRGVERGAVKRQCLPTASPDVVDPDSSEDDEPLAPTYNATFSSDCHAQPFEGHAQQVAECVADAVATDLPQEHEDEPLAPTYNPTFSSEGHAQPFEGHAQQVAECVADAAATNLLQEHRPSCPQCLAREGEWPLRGICAACWLEHKCICHSGKGECLGCDPAAVAAHAHCAKNEYAARKQGIPLDSCQTASFKIEQAFCLIRNRGDRLAESRNGHHAPQEPDYQKNPDGCAPDWLTMFKTAGGDLGALPWHIVGPKFHGMPLPLPDNYNPSMLDFRNVTKRLQASYDERGHGWPYPRSSTHTEAEMVNCHACGATVQWKRFGIHKTKTLRAFGQRASPCMNAQRPGASAA